MRKKIHSCLVQNSELIIILKSCLITIYGKLGHLEEAISIFEKIEIFERDVIDWKMMTTTFAENGSFVVILSNEIEDVKPRSEGFL